MKIRNITRFFLYLGAAFVFQFCSPDEVFIDEGEEKPDGVFYKNPSFKIVGIYDVVKLECEDSVDLNNDGLFSRDLMAETDGWPNAHLYYLEIWNQANESENGPTEYVPMLDIYAPYANAIFNAVTKEYLYTGYGVANINSRIYYSEKKNEVTIFDSSGQGQILSVTVNGEAVEATFRRDFYIHPSFETLTITGSYVKRKER